MMVIKNTHNVKNNFFLTILMTFICLVKTDKYVPHCVKVFLWTLFIQLLDIFVSLTSWHMTYNLNNLSLTWDFFVILIHDLKLLQVDLWVHFAFSLPPSWKWVFIPEFRFTDTTLRNIIIHFKNLHSFLFILSLLSVLGANISMTLVLGVVASILGYCTKQTVMNMVNGEQP